MRKFLLLIRRFWNFILFIILEVLSLYFIAKSHSTQGLDVINSTNGTVAFFYQKEQNIISYFNLRKVNIQLIGENKTLRNQLSEKVAVDTFSHITATIPIIEYDKNNKPDSNKTAIVPGVTLRPTGPLKIIRYAKYNYIPARVINNSVSNDRINFITINRGSNSGIKPGMAVVGYNGIVGRVEHVSKHFATIASVLSYRKVSARLKIKEAFGIITWAPGNPDFVQMDNMPITMPVHLRDSVFTTGFANYPPNVLIGTVQKVDTIKSSNTQLLHIKLSTDFRTLQFVYVVGDEMGNEKIKLEAKDNSSQ